MKNDVETKYDEMSIKEAIQDILVTAVLKLIKELHTQKRLSLLEKQLLIDDLIKNNAEGNYSKLQIAFSLIAGPGSPDELFSISGHQLFPDLIIENNRVKSMFRNLHNIYHSIQFDSEIVDEFEAVCHVIANELDD